MHRPFSHTLLALGLALGSAWAAPGEFLPAQTSAKATWFAHLNIDGLRNSDVGKQLIAGLDGEAKRNLRQFERMLNFHPIEDLESATVYGTSSDPEKAVALLRGTFDTERLTGLAKDGNDYRPVPHPKSTIHSWDDKGKRVYATIANDRLVIIGPELDLLRTATDVIHGDSPALEPEKIYGHLSAEHPPIIVASANLEELGSLNLDSKLVRKVKAIYISAGEVDGELLAYAALRTADARSAKLVDQMLHGVLALAEVSEEVPQDVIEAFKTRLDDSGISLSVSLPLKKFKALVAKLEKTAQGLK